jgi:hypothetical protein
VPGPDPNDPLTFEDLFDGELGEVTQPEVVPGEDAALAIGSDIHAVPRRDGRLVNRPPLDGIDAVLVAYLLDIDEANAAADAGTAAYNDPPGAQQGLAVATPEPPKRR